LDQPDTLRTSLLGFRKFDVLEGPPELSLQFEPGQVHASTTRECPKPVKGGTILVTAKDVTEKKEDVFTFRAHMRTEEGPRLATFRYKMLLFPASEQHGDVPSTRQHAEELATKASKRFDDVVEARQLVEIKEAKQPEAADNAVGSARGMAGEMRHHRKRKKFGSRPKVRGAYSSPRAAMVLSAQLRTHAPQ
jgi:hypothetical protein